MRRAIAAIAAGVPTVLPPAGAHAGVLPAPFLPASAVSVGAAMRWIPVCGRGRPIGSGSWDTTDSYIFDVTACTIPIGLGLRALKLSYMGSDLSNVGEIDRSVTFTGDASISVPSVQFSVVVSAPAASGASALSVQVAQGSTGNGVTVGMGVQGTSIPSGSWVTAVTPVVSSNNVTAYTFTFANASGAGSTTAGILAGAILTITGRNHVATWGGQRVATIFPARRFFESDPIGISLAGGSQFFVRGSWSASGTGFFVGDYPSASSGASRLAGEGSQRSAASIGDHVLDQAVPSNSGGGYFSPWTVLGQTASAVPSVLLVGDSICAGTGDAADVLGHMGYMERSLGGAVPWASLCRGSTSALQMSVDLQLVEQAASAISATDVLLQYGRNDINAAGNPQSAATTEASLKTIAAPLITAGYRVWVFTIPPTTDSTDAWATSSGQFMQTTSATTTSTTSAGSAGGVVSVSVASSSGVSQGMLVGLQNTVSSLIPNGTVVSAVSNSSTVLIMPPAGQSIGAIPSGSTLGFGTKTASAVPAEVQREAFNNWCRSAALAAGYAGCIDDDLVFEDPVNTGLWRTDLGSASVDGIHPSATLHSAVVTSGIINPSLFPAR